MHLSRHSLALAGTRWHSLALALVTPPFSRTAALAARKSLLPLLLALLGLSLLPAAHAATLTVTSTADDGSVGTLRSALAAANFGDSIVFNVPANSTITLTQGQLNINTPVTVTGPAGGITINGNHQTLIFSVFGGSATFPVTLSDLTLYNGYLSTGLGGGIDNNGTLLLTNCTLTANNAGNSNPSRGFGAGLYNTGTATLTNCTVSGNSASGGTGGGVYNSGLLTLNGCTLAGNGAAAFGGGRGGGLYNSGTATLSGCTFIANYSGYYGSGGGIDNDGTVTLTNCVFNQNSAAEGGGLNNNITATVTNCTFTENSISGYDGNTGGGLYSSNGNAKTTLTNDIFYADPGSEIVGPGVTATFCDIQGGYTGTGNINTDPLFERNSNPTATPPDYGNLHLVSPFSPCLGAGATQTEAPAGVTIPTTDIDGITRPSPPSIGAYDSPSVNAAPTLTGLSPSSATAGSGPLTLTLTGTGFLAGTTISFGGTALAYTGQMATHLTATIPASLLTTPDSFSVTVSNPSPGGGTSGPQTFTVNAAPVPPTANAQTVTIPFNTATAVTLTGTDPQGEALTYAVKGGPTSGTLSGTAPNLTYTPAVGSHGPDSFTFTVTDTGGLTSAPSTVSLHVLPGAPTANGQFVAVAFNAAKAITLTGTDPDVPELPLTYAYKQPSHGTLTGTAPNVTYTPNPGSHGADGFTFTVNNGANTSAPATVTLTVATGTPTATAQTVITSEGVATALTLSSTDPDSPALPLTYAVVSGPDHGTLSGTAPILTYTPAAYYSGPDSVTFTVSNGTNASAPATVSVTVTPVTASVSGTVTLQGWKGGVQPLTFTLTPTGGGAATTQTLTLTPTSGVFAFTLPGIAPGTYTLGVKGALWLREDAPVAFTTTAGVSSVALTLPAGDVNSDNAVSQSDLNLLKKAYGSTSKSANWDPRADLNGDGVVSLADLNLLKQNYGKQGQPH